MTTVNNLIIAKLNTLKSDFFNEVQERFNKIRESAKNIRYTDLKLHHASHELYKYVQDGILTEEQGTSLFQHMCEVEYDHFQEWEKENLSYVSRSYISRSSSFYYLSSFDGNVVDSWFTDDLLKGKQVYLKDLIGGLVFEIYDYLVEDEKEEAVNTILEILEQEYELSEMTIDELKEAVEEFFESEESILSDALEDLKEIEEIVKEALKAYEYLSEFKTIENEKELLKHYMESDIENHIAEETAENILDAIAHDHRPLNKITSFNITVGIVGDDYVINCESNWSGSSYTIANSKYNISKVLAEQVLKHLQILLKHYFDLN